MDAVKGAEKLLEALDVSYSEEWHTFMDATGLRCVHGAGGRCIAVLSGRRSTEDAEVAFIAASPALVRGLLAEVKSLRGGGA